MPPPARAERRAPGAAAPAPAAQPARRPAAAVRRARRSRGTPPLCGGLPSRRAARRRRGPIEARAPRRPDCRPEAGCVRRGKAGRACVQVVRRVEPGAARIRVSGAHPVAGLAPRTHSPPHPWPHTLRPRSAPAAPRRPLPAPAACARLGRQRARAPVVDRQVRRAAVAEAGDLVEPAGRQVQCLACGKRFLINMKRVG